MAPRKKKKVTWPQAKAFSVHLLTASGSFLAFLSVVAASEQRWTSMFLWLGLALFVDGIDGPIARKLQVKEVLPNWSGDTLDNIIDYITYVLIPAFALYRPLDRRRPTPARQKRSVTIECAKLRTIQNGLRQQKTIGNNNSRIRLQRFEGFNLVCRLEIQRRAHVETELFCQLMNR